MKLLLRNIFLFLFVITTLTDVVTTTIIKFKHPIFNESNPLFVFGVSFWVLLALILVVKGYLLWFCTKRYHKVRQIWVRYIVIYFIVLMVLINFGAIITNIRVINTPSEDIVQGTPEQNLQSYKEQVGDMKVLENLTPYRKGWKMPLMMTFFLINLLQFMVWQSFEVHEWKRK